jgi:arylsulfatase A-like enzyme
LPLQEKTMADRLREAGYATVCIGKWHLGGETRFLPMNRGFDEFYGTVANTPFFNPPNFIDSRVSAEITPVQDTNFYTTDAYTARAADWLERNHQKPWFMYLPFNAQHAPLQATPKYLNRFPNIEDDKRKTFAAMMSAMDDAVGAVLKKVRDLKQEENTLIFFLSDNGGPTRSTTSTNGPLRGFKATTWEGGVRVPFCFQWKGHIKPGQVYEAPIIQLDILPTALAAAGVKIDPAWKLDGVNLLPYLTGENKSKPHETLYWRFGEQWAIRHGDYKLVEGREGDNKAWLIHLAKDISEANDLSATEPEKVKQLRGLWEAWNKEQMAPLWQPAQAPGQRRQRAR